MFVLCQKNVRKEEITTDCWRVIKHRVNEKKGRRGGRREGRERRRGRERKGKERRKEKKTQYYYQRLRSETPEARGEASGGGWIWMDEVFTSRRRVDMDGFEKFVWMMD